MYASMATMSAEFAQSSAPTIIAGDQDVTATVDVIYSFDNC